jgi:hypothetical protein
MDESALEDVNALIDDVANQVITGNNRSLSKMGENYYCN